MQYANAPLGNFFIPTVYLIMNIGTLKHGPGLISQFRLPNLSSIFFLRRFRFLWFNLFTRNAPSCEFLFCGKNYYTRIKWAFRVLLCTFHQKITLVLGLDARVRHLAGLMGEGKNKEV